MEASRRGLFSRLGRKDAGEADGDWLTSASWDRDAFEKRLRRTRPSERAHCLRRKASALLESGDPALDEPAAWLLGRVLREHGDEDPELAAAHALLASLCRAARRRSAGHRPRRAGARAAG